MRVVLLGSRSPERPGNASVAAMSELASALGRRGLDVGLVTPSEPAPDGDTLLATLRRLGGWPSVARHRRAMRRAAEAELAAGADVVHAHSWFPAGLVAPDRIPLVLTTYGSDVTVLRRSRLARRLAAPVFERAAVITAVSREVGDGVQNLTGRHVSHAHVQPMPVDARSWPWTAGGGGAVAIGDLVDQQRLELAIHTVAVLASCGHALPLTIIGEGPRRNDLARIADLNGVEALVRFVSGASPDDILRYLSTADLVIHPAKGEAVVPWVLAAVLVGVPILGCWDGGAVVEFVSENGSGHLTLPSTEALSDAALGMLMQPDRLDTARLIGEAWRARLAPEHVAEAAERWYHEAMGLGAPVR